MTSDLDVLALLCRVGGQAQPVNLFLLLGNDVHSHEHVESVVHTATNVLVVNLEGGEGEGGEGRGGRGERGGGWWKLKTGLAMAHSSTMTSNTKA